MGEPKVWRCSTCDNVNRDSAPDCLKCAKPREKKAVRFDEFEAPDRVKALDEAVGNAVARRVQGGNTAAVEELGKFLKWVPEYTPHNDDYGKTDRDAPFVSESYLYNLLGKDEARTVLAYLGSIARALGLTGLNDPNLRE
jgi:hypothetical protein